MKKISFPDVLDVYLEIVIGRAPSSERHASSVVEVGRIVVRISEE